MKVNRNKAVMITGTSSGIGRACALYLDRLGYRVLAGVRNVEAGKRLIKECSDHLHPVILDITVQDQVKAAAASVTELLGDDPGIHGLVNNAGIGVGGPLEFFPLGDLRRQFEVNVIGQLAVTQAFLPLIRRGRGRIINIGSMAGRFAFPFSGPYAASKFALRGLSDALRRELRPWGIPVVLLEPGSVSTPIWEKAFSDAKERLSAIPSGAREHYESLLVSVDKMMRAGAEKGMSAPEVARIVGKALGAKRPKIRYVVGRDAHLGMISRYLPDGLLDWVVEKVIAGELPTRLMGW